VTTPTNTSQHAGRRRLLRRPVVEPLSADEEIALRRTLIELAFAAWEHADSWAQAERLALATLDNLRAEGLHVLKVRWRS
jgi:hypothetical protein